METLTEKQYKEIVVPSFARLNAQFIDETCDYLSNVEDAGIDQFDSALFYRWLWYSGSN